MFRNASAHTPTISASCAREIVGGSDRPNVTKRYHTAGTAAAALPLSPPAAAANAGASASSRTRSTPTASASTVNTRTFARCCRVASAHAPARISTT